MNERELPNLSYFWACLEFPSDTLAYRYFVEVNERLSGKGLDLGVYRHGPTDEAKRWVTLVSIKREGIRKAEQMPLAGAAVDYDLDQDQVDALMLRRARMVMAIGNDGPRTVRIRHAGEGATLTPEGELIEKIGGDE